MVNIPKNKVSAGRILIKPRGEWDANITYEMLDLVNHNGYAYLAKRTVVGIEPSDEHSSYWHNMLDIKTIVENSIAGTMADDVGAILEERFKNMLSEARYVPDLIADFTEATFVKWDAETLNTPYKEELTDSTEGFALVYGDAENHTITAWTKGGAYYDCYMHNIHNKETEGWITLSTMFDDKFVPIKGGSMTGPLGLGGGKGQISADDECTFLESKKDDKNYTGLKIVNPSSEDASIEDSVKVVSSENESKKEYNLYGEHNDSSIGLAKIEVHSYEGNGDYGANKPTKYTFKSPPKMVVLMTTTGIATAIWLSGVTHWRGGSPDSEGDNPNFCYVNVSGDTISWYSTDNQHEQFNTKGQTYTLIGLL